MFRVICYSSQRKWIQAVLNFRLGCDVMGLASFRDHLECLVEQRQAELGAERPAGKFLAGTREL